MTTIDTAAVQNTMKCLNRQPAKHLASGLAWVAISLATLGLAGCETSSSLIGSNSGPGASPAIVQAQAGQQATPKAEQRIAVAPVIGPPDGVAKAIVAQLSTSAEQQKVSVTKTAGEPSSYTLRGYFVAPTKDKAGNKLSYIWDVTDPAGKRVNRITGEEVLAPVTGNDPWVAVTPQIMQSISDKTAASLAAWLPTQTQGAVPIAGTQPNTPAVAQSPLPAPTLASAPANGTTTGSIPGAILSTAPRVTGAPGDGNASLAAAMRRELEEKGIQVSEQGQNVYRVAADVKLKAAKEGMQAIAINWTINDPKGAEVAKITQNNEIPAGFLDKTWGASAEDAAKAASVQIKQVISDHRAGKRIQSSASTTDRKVN